MTTQPARPVLARDERKLLDSLLRDGGQTAAELRTFCDVVSVAGPLQTLKALGLVRHTRLGWVATERTPARKVKPARKPARKPPKPARKPRAATPPPPPEVQPAEALWLPRLGGATAWTPSATPSGVQQVGHGPVVVATYHAGVVVREARGWSLDEAIHADRELP